MSVRGIRFVSAATVAVAGVLLAASCADDTGPGRPVHGQFALEPVFASAAAGIVPVTAGRFTIRRTADNAVVKDTVVTLGAEADSVNLSLTVVVNFPGETFQLSIGLVNATGDTVFRAGPLTVTPSTTGDGAGPAIPVPLTYTGVGADAQSIIIGVSDTALFFGAELTATATVFDSAGQPIPNTPIAWRSLETARVTVARADSGRVTVGTQRGAGRVVAELLTGPADTLTLTAQPVPIAISVDGGNNQTGPPGAPLPQPLVARVFAADALGVAGQWVRFVVTNGGGSVAPDSVETDAEGRASVTFTLGPSGTQTVQATTAMVIEGSAVFGATVAVQRATALVIVSGADQIGTVGAALAGPVVVEARDAGNEPFPGDTVVFQIVSGGGTVSTDTVVTAGTGQAQTTWTLGPGAGDQEVRARLITDAALQDIHATAVADAAARLSFTVEPTATPLNGTITPHPAVTALDQFGNVATTFTGNVLLALLNNPGGATLSGTTTRAAVAGLATFTDLSLNMPGNGFTLEATNGSLTTDSSTAFDVIVPQGNVFWINAAGGNWSTGANWSSGAPPTAVDTAIIATAGTFTISVTTPATAGTLIMGGAGSSPTLSVSSTLTIADSAFIAGSGTLNQPGGTVGGPGTVVLAGTWNWSSGTIDGGGTTRILPGGLLMITNSGTLNDRDIENDGTTIWTSGNVNAGNGATFVNLANGTFMAQGAGTVWDWGFGTQPVFTNEGAFVVNTISTVFMDWLVDLVAGGAVSVASGTFQPRAGGILGSDISLGPGAVLQITAGTFDADQITISGGGSVLLSGGTLAIGGTDTLTMDVPFTQSGGQFGDTGVLLINQTFTWTGGTMDGGGVLRIPAAATFTIAGAVTLGQRDIENAGTTLWTTGNVTAGNNATFLNEPGGIFSAQSLAGVWDWGFGAQPVFTNQGTMTVNTTGAVFMDWILDLTAGTFTVDGGTFQQRSTASIATDVTVAAGTTFEIIAGTTTADQITIGGAGLARLSGGVLQVADPDTLTFALPFVQVGGQITGTGVVFIPETFTWNGGTIDGGGVLRIADTATLTIAGAVALGDRDVENAGTAFWTAGNVNAGNGALFINLPTGTFNAQAPGVVWDWGFGAQPTFTNQGTALVNTTGTVFMDWLLDLSAGTFTVADGTFTPRGGGTLATDIAVDGLASFNLNAGTYTADAITVAGTGTALLSGGVLTLAAPDTITFGLPFAQTGGQITGTGAVLIPEAFLWSGGTIDGGGVLRIADTAVFTLTTPGTLGDRDVENAGVTVWTAGGLNAGNGATFLNEATGSFIAQAAGVVWDWGFGTQPTFTNNGQLLVNSAGIVFMDWTFVLSAGTFTVEVGTFTLRGGGSLAADFGIDATATLNLNAGTFTADAITVANPDGLLLLSGGILTVASPDTLRIERFQQSGGQVAGTGTLLILTQAEWLGGSLTGAGSLSIPSDASLIISNPGILDTRTLHIQGSVDWNAGSLNAGNAALIVNEGTFEVTAPNVVLDYGFGAQPTFDNQGLFRTVGGSVAIDWGFNNSGTLDAQSGTIAPRSTVVHNATGVIQGSGTVDVSLANVLSFVGTVAPGTSPGLLTWTGNYSPVSPAELDIELSGTTVGTGYDRLAISGVATPHGTLNVSLVGFTPAAGQQFTIMTYGSIVGDFDVVNLPALTPPLSWQRTINATSMVLTVMAPPQVVFAGDSTGGLSGIFRVNPDGTGRTRVTSEGPPASTDTYPRWSPNRDRITYGANPGAGPNQLHIASPDGSEIAHLTGTGDVNTFRGRFNATGQRIAFACDGTSPLSLGNVCVIPDVSGPIASLNGIGDDAVSGKVRVTDAVDNNLTSQATFAWDPVNPNRLVVVRDSVLGPLSRAGSQLWLVNFDGSGATRLTTTALVVGTDTLQVEFLDWAPNGTFIVLSAIDQQFNASLYRVEVPSGAVTQLTFPSTLEDDEQPVISPDNSTILFIRNNFALEASSWNLFRMPAAGGPVTQLTAESPSVFFNLESITYDWSPDGTAITMVGTNGTAAAIYQITPATTPTSYNTSRQLLSRVGAFDVQPSWRP